MMVDKKADFTSSRKLDHLRICLEEEIESGSSGFEDISLVHNALPDIDMDSVDLSTVFLDNEFSSPLFISAMTGGHPDTRTVNSVLASAAEKFGIGMGVGSQRAAIENPDLEETFTVVRDTAPNAFLVGNIGIVQLRDHGSEWAERAVSMIEADALAVHLNFLQEAIQPEGDHDAKGCLEALKELCSDFKTPVIVKETGCGISQKTAEQCLSAGVAAIDTGGAGGSSWALIESFRAAKGDDPDQKRLERLGRLYSDWGIPTALSLYQVQKTNLPVIASGGIRTGIDIAKAVAMGAKFGGMALPLLKPAFDGPEALFDVIEEINQQVRTAMFLTGCSDMSDLCNSEWHMTGRIRDMVFMK